MHLKSILGRVRVLDVYFVDIRGYIHRLAVDDRDIWAVLALIGLLILPTFGMSVMQLAEAIFCLTQMSVHL